MAIDYTFFTTALRDTIYFNISWLFNLVATGITLLIITKDVERWKTLAFPITVAWHIAGLAPSILVYFATALMFVITNLSMKTIGNIVSTINRKSEMFKSELERQEKSNIRQKIKWYLGGGHVDPKTRSKVKESIPERFTRSELRKIRKRGL